MLWNWLRNKARDAVLAGIADALDHMEQGDSQDVQPALTALASRLTPRLPAPKANGKAKREATA